MTVTRSHKGGAKPTTLAGSLSSSATAFSVATGGGTGFPDGTGGVFVVCIEAGRAGEEKILCSARSADTFTVAGGGRGYDDTTAVLHDSNAPVIHSYSAIEAQEANAHIVATVGAHAASAISVTPTGGLSSTQVQAALAELDTEKVAVTLVDAKGDLLVGSADNTIIREAVGTDDQVLVADSTASGGVKWAVPKGLIIGSCYYDPGSEVDHLTNTTTFAAMDTTNLRATFVAPASGAVIVDYGCWTSTNNATDANSSIGILDGATVKTLITNGYTNVNHGGPCVGSKKITGLTPGTTYNYDLANAADAVPSAGVVVAAYGGDRGPAYIKILAA